MKIISTFETSCCLSQIAGNRILENGLGREICIHKTSLTQNARRQAEVMKQFVSITRSNKITDTGPCCRCDDLEGWGKGWLSRAYPRLEHLYFHLFYLFILFASYLLA